MGCHKLKENLILKGVNEEVATECPLPAGCSAEAKTMLRDPEIRGMWEIIKEEQRREDGGSREALGDYQVVEYIRRMSAQELEQIAELYQEACDEGRQWKPKEAKQM